jgi:heptosyltransferase-2
LHPSNRSHWIPWLAGIPTRIGYHRKWGWLLTHRVPHRKQEGQRHEAVYTLELLASLGIEPPSDPRPTIALSPRANQRIDAVLSTASCSSTDRLVAMHPSASCVSKRWMPERFAKVADQLIAQQGVRVCVVAGASDALYANQMVQAMTQPALDLAGQLSVAELAALLHRCRLLISNDSGPVHIAAAVGTPVVDIFGRNQRGLSPLRWGPLGEGHIILHKEVGCVTCLAHNCDIDFLCLTSLEADEVYRAAVTVLRRRK